MRDLQICQRLHEHFLVLSMRSFALGNVSGVWYPFWFIYTWIFFNAGHEYVGICFYVVY